MSRLPREYFLDYLSEYPIGKEVGRRRRNVPLRAGYVPSLIERAHFFNWNTFAWKLAQRLEGREGVIDNQGIWPINGYRCERRYGNPGSDLFPKGSELDSAALSTYDEAREMRRLCYHRVTHSSIAEQILTDLEADLRFSFEVTPEWYDPPDGQLVVPYSQTDIRGSHSMPLSSVMNFGPKHGNYFWFRNSWGREWGHNGEGGFSAEHFDRLIIECWHAFGAGLFVPYETKRGIVCLEWKWSKTDAIAIHGREIIEAETSDRLAWAFCMRRDGYLDVEEFYVWPSERGKGYGRELSRMCKTLAANMNLQLRLMASFADTEPENLENLQSAARILGVNLSESSERWVHMLGTANPVVSQRTRNRPMRPAMVVESLRPCDEKADDTPIEYEVYFGTNRCQTPGGFGVGRDAKLHIGSARVTIPRSHRFGSKGRAWQRFWNLLMGRGLRIAEMRRFKSESELGIEFGNVLATLDKNIDLKPHNLLYVHGFNVSFDAAIKQAAQFGVDLKIPGATFVFSWPSAERIGGYTVDEATVEASVDYLTEFMSIVLRQTGDTPLSILVHSMGNRAVLRALEAFSQDANLAANGRIGDIILAAPDVDADVFQQVVPKFLSLGRRTTLYATRADLAVLASQWLHGKPRAGIAPPVLTLPGLDTVLVEDFNLFDIGHGYCAEASHVLHDIFTMLHYDVVPKRRPKLLAAQTLDGRSYWKLSLL